MSAGTREQEERHPETSSSARMNRAMGQGLGVGLDWETGSNLFRFKRELNHMLHNSPVEAQYVLSRMQPREVLLRVASLGLSEGSFGLFMRAHED